MAVAVTNLKYETVEGGMEARVTVVRFPEGRWLSEHADPKDLPADLADALRDWLKTAPTLKEENPDG